MPFIDILILSLIAAFTLFGLWFGFVHTLGSLIGTVVGVYLASRYYEPVAEWLIAATGWGDNVAKVLVFVIAFFLINRLVGIFFWFFQKFSGIVTKLPIISSINRFFGLLLGFAEGVLTIGVVLYFIARFPLSDRIMQSIEVSEIAPHTLQAAQLLLPFLPEGLRILESTVNYVETMVTT